MKINWGSHKKSESSKEEEVEMPGLLFTAGYDDSMAIFNLKKYPLNIARQTANSEDAQKRNTMMQKQH